MFLINTDIDEEKFVVCKHYNLDIILKAMFIIPDLGIFLISFLLLLLPLAQFCF